MNNRRQVLKSVKRDGESLKHASEELKNDKKVVLEAVKQNGNALKYASEELRNDRKVVLEAVKQKGNLLRVVSKKLKNDRKVVLEAVKQKGYYLKFAGEEARNDKVVVLEVVKQDGNCLRYAGEEARNDKEVVLEAVKQGGYALQCASEELKNNKEVVLEALKQKGYYLEFASEALKNDKEVVLEAVKQNGDSLKYASEEIKNDKEVVLEALKQDGNFLQYASEEVKNDKKVVLEAVKQKANAIHHASKELVKEVKKSGISPLKWLNARVQKQKVQDFNNNKEVVLGAVKKHGRSLQYASEELKNDREVVMEAVKQDGLALQYAGEELKKDREVVLEAVTVSEGDALQYASKVLKNDQKFVLEAVKRNKKAFRFANEDLVSEAKKSGMLDKPVEWLEVSVQKEGLKKQLEEERKITDSVKNENQKILDSVLDSVGRRFRIPHKQLQIHREGKLGKGGFGSVFKADWMNDMGEKKEVAVKVIGYGFQTNAKEVFKEFSRSLQFRHKNVIQTFGFDDSRRNEIAIVMEKLDGNIHDYVRENVLTLGEKLDLMLKMTKGIKYLHNMEPKPFIHRDIKGENFLYKLAEDGELLDVKVCDFGLAKATTGTETQVSAAGQGTKLWMAPEAGKGLYSVKSDVYSLAVSFWEILFEEYPYGELDPNHVFYKVGVEGLAPAFDMYNNKNKKNDEEEDEGEEEEEDGEGVLPTELKKMLERCWDGDRKKRPTIQDVILWFEDTGEEFGMEYGDEHFPPLKIQKEIKDKVMRTKEGKQQTEQKKEVKKEKKQRLKQFRDLKEKGKLKAFVIGQNGDGFLSAHSDGMLVSSELKKMGYKCTEELYKGDEERLLTCVSMKKNFRRFLKSLEEGDRVLFYFSCFGFQQEGRNFLVCAKIYDDDEVIDRVVELNFFTKELRKLKTENAFILDFCQLDPNNEKWKEDLGRLEPIEGGKYVFGFTCSKEKVGGSVVKNSLLKYVSKEDNLTFLKRATAGTLEDEEKGGGIFMGDLEDL